MQGLNVIYNKILTGVDVDSEATLTKYGESDRFFVVEGMKRDSDLEVRLLVYDCSQGKEFDFEEYKKNRKQEEESNISDFAMIFDNLDQESLIRQAVYEKLKLANERKLFNKWFEEKIPIYLECEDSIEVEVEESGINYLEYKYEDELYGFIYNVTYSELKKVLNVTGKNLFKENVRIGLRDRKSQKLKEVFKDYIKVALFQKMSCNLNSEEQNEVKELLDLDDELIKSNTPELFWFCHNGVTIFSFDKEQICRRNNKIKLNPYKISVINGAQTLTNFYNVLNETKYEFGDLMTGYEKIDLFDANWLEAALFEIGNSIRIKTIIIDGSDEYIRKISEGLNTHIPIEIDELLAVSSEVLIINKNLKKYRISIMRDGDKNSDNNLSVLDFVKKYLIIKGKPGRSKNLSKSQLEDFLKKAVGETEKEDFCKKLNLLIDLDSWWSLIRRKKLEGVFQNNEYSKFYRYGKNYFGSYILQKNILDIDEENLFNLFNQFLYEFSQIKTDVSLEDFKKDDLYDEYIKHSLQVEHGFGNLQEVREELCSYLNSNLETKYVIAKKISTFLLQKKIILDYFRVISVVGNYVKEAYPFPRSTFTELYQNLQEGESVSNVEYLESEWKKEINKKFIVFVLHWEKDSSKIAKIDIIQDFSFKKFEKNAKCVFDKTKDAFEKGSEMIFPKSSENLNFHVRPKAANREDTFQFSNGNQITKRTFWANKETIKRLLEEYGVLDNEGLL